jgi:hypothetical protein
VPHPFRFLLRKGWDTNEIQDYTISENAQAAQPRTEDEPNDH